jgi:glycerophosphoryl diester phosphodiesterase
MTISFYLQGHRGARGLKPENTLPSFEIALDHGVTSIETDVHLTRDDVPILTHDAVVSERLCRLRPEVAATDPASQPLVRSLTLEQLRNYRADVNPDRQRFPTQDAVVTPLAQLFAQEKGLDPFALPTVADLFAFAAAYAGEPGVRAGKTAAQRERAGRVGFDLELKRVPFRPEFIGDDFDGESPALLERRLVEVIQAAGVLGRTMVRSFDHRAVRALRMLEPGLAGAVLVDGTAPVMPAELACQADAAAYCPDYRFLDARQVRQAHSAGVRVVPWTVNEPEAWRQLLDWGVDGITTDYPDRLAEFLAQRGVRF